MFYFDFRLNSFFSTNHFNCGYMQLICCDSNLCDLVLDRNHFEECVLKIRYIFFAIIIDFVFKIIFHIVTYM